MNAKQPIVKAVHLTPEIAQTLLENNRTNRAIKMRQVQNLAKAITAGQWDSFNGETLVVDDTGALLDGQHRCAAVILAETPIDTLICYGVDAKKRGSIDTGFKRTLGDFFDMHGIPNGRTLSSATLWLHAYEEDALQRTQGAGLPFTSYQEGLRFLEKRGFMAKCPNLIARFSHLLPPAGAIGLVYLFHESDSAICEAFLAMIQDGEGRESYPVFWLLREKLIKHASARAKLPHVVLQAWAILAWNATKEHRAIRTIRWRDDAGRSFPRVR